MSDPRRNQRPRRRRQGQGQNKPLDLWRRVPAPDDLDPIEPATDPTALIDSLPEPPLGGHSAAGAHYVAAVVERAALIATALASSAGVLAEPRDE